MLIAIVAVLVGVVVLAVAADQFVIGASRVALIRQVPAFVVGVVIVGFGTSAPEMLVSGLAAARGAGEVAVGNVVGSNIANLSLLLGVGAIMVPLGVDSRTVKREAMLVVLAVAGFGAAVQGGGISRIDGLLLIAAMGIALWIVTRSPESGDVIGAEAVDLVNFEPTHRLRTEITRTVVGLLGTIAAAQLLLWGALRIADIAGLSEGFVGATLVAVGTSLPELVTVVQSARRNETDLIVGNLLGSNLFNALAVGGLIGLIGGAGVTASSLTVVAASAAIVIALVAAVAMRTGHAVTRREGIMLVVGYLVLIPFLT